MKQKTAQNTSRKPIHGAPLWIPAFAGMANDGVDSRLRGNDATHHSPFAVSDAEPIPGLQHQAAGEVFAEGLHFFLLEHPEGFGGIVLTLDIGGVEEVAQLVAGEAVKAGVPGIQLGAELAAAVGVPGERVAGIAQVLGPGAQLLGGVGEFEDAWNDEVEVGWSVGVWGQIRDLLFDVIAQVRAADLLPCDVIMDQGVLIG